MEDLHIAPQTAKSIKSLPSNNKETNHNDTKSMFTIQVTSKFKYVRPQSSNFMIGKHSNANKPSVLLQILSVVTKPSLSSHKNI